MNKYNVYYHKNLINNKYYIGITCQKPNHRWGKDGHNYSLQPKFFNAIQKYGWDNFEHIIYAEKLSQEQALALEKQLIEKYDSINCGYNISPYGGVGYKKAVRCITLDIVFNSVAEAAEFANVHPSGISTCLHGRQLTAGEKNGIRLEWTFVNELENQDKIIQQQIRQKKEEDIFGLRKIWIEEFTINHLSIRDISKKYHSAKETVSNFLKSQGIQVLPSHITQSKPVACFNDKWEKIQSFPSMSSALRHFGYTDSACSQLKKVCNDSSRIFCGYHWKYLDDYEIEEINI